MATYVPISEAEILAALPAPKWVKAANAPAHTKELVLDFPVAAFPGIVVRVYTSILPHGGARKRGTDAIRVCAVDTIRGFGLIKAARVHRVEGWRKNLETRVMAVWQEVFVVAGRLGYVRQPVAGKVG